MAADHTLTLIFDSDEEMSQEFGTVLNSGYDRNAKNNEQKRLSEIVEDYLDESNQTPDNGKDSSRR